MKQNTLVFPIEAVREQFPALGRVYNGKPAAYLDGPGGSQTVQSSIKAIAGYMERGGANLHGRFPSSRETEEIIREARSAAADFLNTKPEEIAFGANMTTLTLSISRALGRSWGPGDEIVVTEMDHHANIDPWLQIAEDRGMTVRWIKADADALTLSLDDIDEIINEKTVLVAVGLASNAVGTIVRTEGIVKRAKEAGALVAMDAVHAAPHIPIDRDKLGADILLCSAYKFFGPHIGIAAVKEEVFSELKPYKLQPSPAYYPDKLETGTQNHEGLAGIEPAIGFFEKLGSGESRRERIVSGLRAAGEYEDMLQDLIRSELGSMPHIVLYQAADDIPKTPTIAFKVKGFEPEEVCSILAEQHSLFLASGDFYASTLGKRTGVSTSGGWIRAGLAPYNTKDEALRLINAVSALKG
ncbi:cysteine desulfurase-like protein [Peribacillus sp. SCS-37]|uniref:cysteine desulfurase-like protein n=1 Tax=Paraperibacillus esterisolvens TaxID=3115296 RepID=UPI003905AE90